MSLLQRFKRRKDREAALISLAAWLEENDPDFRFEIACSNVKEILKKYSPEDLRTRYLTMVGAGGGGGAGGA